MPAKHKKTAGFESKPSLITLVTQSLDDDKAEQIIAIDLQGKSSIADAMIIATGRSGRQMGAMAAHLQEKLKKAGIRNISIEGLEQGEWVLIDGGDVIVHLFRPETRRLYNLEKMWGAALPESEESQPLPPARRRATASGFSKAR